MKALTWERLTNIRTNEKPYRGTTNRYPVGKRTHNTKNFYVEQRDGEEVYVITYGLRHKEIIITKEEHLANPKTTHVKNWETDESQKYCKYEVMPNELGVVRSDNTFEFTAEVGFGQGSNQVMSSWSRGYFFNSSRHGGMVYRDPDVFHPIFKGMRLNCDTMMPHEGSQYRVVGKRVNRKEGKEFLKRYADFYTITEVMLKTMDWKGFMETGVDVVKPLISSPDQWYLSSEDKGRLIDFAEKNINDAPLDACLAYLCAYDIQNMRRRVEGYGDQNSWYNRSELDLETVYNNLKRRLNKEIYKANPCVMNFIEYTPTKPYPPSEWGVDIFVGDKEVQQY